MKHETLVKTITEIPGGRFFRMRYLSHMPVKAEYAKQGVAVVKVVDLTARTGIKYANIEGVTLSESTGNSTRENNWEWVVPNRIKHNTNTGKDYMVIAPTKQGCNAKSSYLLSTKDGNTVVSKEEIMDYVIDSHWKKDANRPIRTIALENILSIN